MMTTTSTTTTTTTTTTTATVTFHYIAKNRPRGRRICSIRLETPSTTTTQYIYIYTERSKRETDYVHDNRILAITHELTTHTHTRPTYYYDDGNSYDDARLPT
jgi:hypothetical protein